MKLDFSHLSSGMGTVGLLVMALKLKRRHRHEGQIVRGNNLCRRTPDVSALGKSTGPSRYRGLRFNGIRFKRYGICPYLSAPLQQYPTRNISFNLNFARASTLSNIINRRHTSDKLPIVCSPHTLASNPAPHDYIQFQYIPIIFSISHETPFKYSLQQVFGFIMKAGTKRGADAGITFMKFQCDHPSCQVPKGHYHLWRAFIMGYIDPEFFVDCEKCISLAGHVKEFESRLLANGGPLPSAFPVANLQPSENAGPLPLQDSDAAPMSNQLALDLDRRPRRFGSANQGFSPIPIGDILAQAAPSGSSPIPMPIPLQDEGLDGDAVSGGPRTPHGSSSGGRILRGLSSSGTLSISSGHSSGRLGSLGR